MKNLKKRKRGFDVLRDKTINRSITFGPKERDRLGLRGLLPYRVATPQQMVDRVMANLERLPRDIDRYLLLSGLQEKRAAVLPDARRQHRTLLPIIYADGRRGVPRSHIARTGASSSPQDRGHPPILATGRSAMFASLSSPRARILGLGDLGANGMGIPIEARDLYGRRRHRSNACLLTLDVGTGNDQLRHDVLYLGYPRRGCGARRISTSRRVRDRVQSRYPDALIQFEDFLTPNAYPAEQMRDRVLCFNDDIRARLPWRWRCVLLDASPACDSRICGSCSWRQFGGDRIADLMARRSPRRDSPRRSPAPSGSWT
jgi:malate dehydrogenase (oxaloacetate-decarboxylating)(NADP+)